MAKHKVSKWTKFQEADYDDDKTKEVMSKIVHKTFQNNKYQVDVRDLEDGFQHLSIKRVDKDWIHDWRELQRIKNELCGKEREAVEVYPAESRLVDSANQYHLWVFPEGQRVPFGYMDRLVVEGHDDRTNTGQLGKGSRQRKFYDNDKPEDIISNKEAQIKAKDFLEGVD